MRNYIHQKPDWPDFRYDSARLQTGIAEVARRQGLLMGRLEALGFTDLQDASLTAITAEIIQSSEIEGEHLNLELVRSSVADRLGIEAGGILGGDRRVEGVVEIAMDVANRWDQPLDAERLLGWHNCQFPTGRTHFGKIKVAEWRDDANGPMQVVSGPMGREKIHFEAPAASRLEGEMNTFLDWFESKNESSQIIKAGIAHLWFLTVHPFADGNGRVGRAILDLALARHDRTRWRCYSVSSQIRLERQAYYDTLESTQRRGLDITDWLDWYLNCLANALAAASETISGALGRTRFWQVHAGKTLNERQRFMLARMLGGFEGKMTNRKWRLIAKCSDATASRDLESLHALGILRREGEGRNVRYELVI